MLNAPLSPLEDACLDAFSDTNTNIFEHLFSVKLTKGRDILRITIRDVFE